MQVSLVSSKGLPDDAIISIRSGAVRRQGSISSQKPFQFPKNATETDCVVKVDIMQNIGSGYIVVKPNSAECKQYQVAIGDKPEMLCEVLVQPTDANAVPAPESQDESAIANKTQDAKEYMASTGLLQFVQGALQVVVKQQPKDPYSEMAKHFLSGYGAAKISDTTEADTTPPPGGAVDAAVVETKAGSGGVAEPEAKDVASDEQKTSAEVNEDVKETAASSPVTAEKLGEEAQAEAIPETPQSPKETISEPKEGEEKAPQEVVLDDDKSAAAEDFTSTLQGAVSEGETQADKGRQGSDEGQVPEAACDESPPCANEVKEAMEVEAPVQETTCADEKQEVAADGQGSEVVKDDQAETGADAKEESVSEPKLEETAAAAEGQVSTEGSKEE